MAKLDFSDVILDLDLGSRFSVIRRTEVVGSDGRPTITEALVAENVLGVVTQGTSGDQVFDDAQRAARQLNVTTKFRLRDTSDGFQADVVLFNGLRFTVNSVQPATHFGTGFVKAKAECQKPAAPPLT